VQCDQLRAGLKPPATHANACMHGVIGAAGYEKITYPLGRPSALMRALI
jgi:hypothetical protein